MNIYSNKICTQWVYLGPLSTGLKQLNTVKQIESALSKNTEMYKNRQCKLFIKVYLNFGLYFILQNYTNFNLYICKIFNVNICKVYNKKT